MSYILDALRKADAQRVRDPARGIHAQAPAATPAAGRSRPGREPWLWGAAAALVAASAAWIWSSADTGAPAPPAAIIPAAGPEGERAAPAAVTAVPPASPVAPAPVIAAPSPVIVPPAPAVATPEFRRPGPRTLAKEAQPVPAAPAPGRQTSVAPPAAPAGPPAAAATPERTYSVAELPADVQQALPKFAISGGVYSDNVTQRMLVVNGQVFNEGSEIAPGVVLEQIRARTAVLKFRGLRITQPY